MHMSKNDKCSALYSSLCLVMVYCRNCICTLISGSSTVSFVAYIGDCLCCASLSLSTGFHWLVSWPALLQEAPERQGRRGQEVQRQHPIISRGWARGQRPTQRGQGGQTSQGGEGEEGRQEGQRAQQGPGGKTRGASWGARQGEGGKETRPQGSRGRGSGGHVIVITPAQLGSPVIHGRQRWEKFGCCISFLTGHQSLVLLITTVMMVMSLVITRVLQGCDPFLYQ